MSFQKFSVSVAKQLDALIERKRDGALENMSLEELEALRNSL